MALCDACGMDNREKAKFCRGCARALVTPVDVPAAPVPAPGPVQVCAACQTANPLAATVCKSCRTSLVPDWVAPPVPVSTQAASGGSGKAVVLIGLVLVLGAGGWWGFRDAGSSGAAPSETLSAEAHQSASLPSVTPTAAITQTTSTTATQPSVTEREQRARDERRRVAAEKKRQQVEREQAAADERERLALAQAQQRTERAAQQKAAQEAAARAQLALASATPAAPPPPAKTVEQTCAGSSNFFSREVCRFQTCRDATFASDPVCIRHREMEAANRRAVTN